MKVLMIGGTGLLGSQAARELISRGHSVHSIALPPLPDGALLPPEMTLTLKNSGRLQACRICTAVAEKPHIGARGEPFM